MKKSKRTRPLLNDIQRKFLEGLFDLSEAEL